MTQNDRSILDDLHTVITDIDLLAGRTVFRNGFAFTSLANVGKAANVYDAIIIRNPVDANCFTPKLGFSSKTLQEHIDFINENRLNKAVVIAADISFLPKCPSLQYLQIVPANDVEQFDYSPIYQLEHLSGLNCATEYDAHLSRKTQLDYSCVPGILDLDIAGQGHTGIDQLKCLQRLNVSRSPEKELFRITTSPRLKCLSITQCKIRTLDALSNVDALTELSLWHNRFLTDVSAVSSHCNSLKSLSIGACPKITDFSFLAQFSHLEHLELVGSNSLPDLGFLATMKSLKTFTFDMNVLDGDLTPCLTIPCVHLLRNRRHYNLTDATLPKSKCL